MIDISLTKEDREFLEQFVKKGVKKARAIARARVLLFADEGYRHDDISKMTNVHRQGIWRIKKRYLEEGLDSAINEKPRSGQPKNTRKRRKLRSLQWLVRLLQRDEKDGVSDC